MGHYKFLTHCFRCLVWFTLLNFHTEASPCPEIEPDACKVHQSNLDMSALNTAMQSLATKMGDAAAAPETPPCDQEGLGSSVADMACSPTENDQICGVEELVHGFKLPSGHCEELFVNQAEGGNSHGVFQSVGSSRIALETVPSYPTLVVADDQVPMLQALHHELRLQQGPANEQQDVYLPALQQAMMEESAWSSDPSLILLPTETADQSMQVPESLPSTTVGGDARAFGAELRKGSNRPESGQPSQQHNAIPLTEVLRTAAEGTESAAQVDACSEVKDLGSVNKDCSARGEFQAPAETSGGCDQELAARSGDGGGAFDKLDPDYLQSVLTKNSKRPGSGDPSKGHN